MAWSGQQEQALQCVKDWIADRRGRQVFRLFGYAGTGKTTIAKEMYEIVKGTVLFACFTGKAALVLRSKGCHNASTIHSLIYKPVEDAHGVTKFKLNPDSPLRFAKLLVVDEVSMVDEELGKDLLSFGIPILVLGDPAQLPPIRGLGFFTDNVEPDFMLTEIHRQAADNPIIQLSMRVRNGDRLSLGSYGDSKIITRQEVIADEVMKCEMIIVGLNRTRTSYNARMRQLLNRNAQGPVKDDMLVCLRNNREKGLLNGGLWKVLKEKQIKKKSNIEGAAEHAIAEMTVRSEDNGSDNAVEVGVPMEFFDGTEDKLNKFYRRNHDEFTYGYALTCHKAQGSQFNSLILFDESYVFREHQRRWLYTGITRAAERIIIVNT